MSFLSLRQSLRLLIINKPRITREASAFPKLGNYSQRVASANNISKMNSPSPKMKKIFQISNDKNECKQHSLQLLNLLNVLRTNTGSETPAVSVLYSKSNKTLLNYQAKGKPLRVNVMKMKLSNFDSERKKALTQLLSSLSPQTDLKAFTQALKSLPGVKSMTTSPEEITQLQQKFKKTATTKTKIFSFFFCTKKKKKIIL